MFSLYQRRRTTLSNQPAVPAYSVVIDKNPNRLNSIRLVFSHILFQAPSRLLDGMHEVFVMLCTALVSIPIGLAMFFLHMAMATFAGFMGYLRLPTASEIERIELEMESDDE